MERRPVTAEVESSSLFRVAAVFTANLISFLLWDLSSAGRASALQAEGHRFEPYRFHIFGWIPEWPKGADCKSVGTAFEGSNPSPSSEFSSYIFEMWELFLCKKENRKGAAKPRPLCTPLGLFLKSSWLWMRGGG